VQQLPLNPGDGSADGFHVDLDTLLRSAVDRGASDVHLKVGQPPIIRHDGQLQRLEGWPSFEPLHLEDVVQTVGGSSPARLNAFYETGELDTAFQHAGLPRFRVNAFRQRGEISMAFRTIPSEVPSFDSLGLPQGVEDLAEEQRGLILVTGATGAGKTTTLAAMIDHINRTRRMHIVSIEDPIEILHNDVNCIVNQREVGLDTESFHEALRRVLRQDPDIILIGEMRDRETISLALTAAETGHLVFGTLHTNSAHKTVDRIIDTFPGELQDQVRSMLSESLRGVVAQQLLRTKGGKGRVAAHEIMVGTPAVSNMIREGKTFQIPSMIQTGKKDGMILMDQSITNLLMSGVIDNDEAYAKAQDKAAFQKVLEERPQGAAAR